MSRCPGLIHTAAIGADMYFDIWCLFIGTCYASIFTVCKLLWTLVYLVQHQIGGCRVVHISVSKTIIPPSTFIFVNVSVPHAHHVQPCDPHNSQQFGNEQSIGLHNTCSQGIDTSHSINKSDHLHILPTFFLLCFCLSVTFTVRLFVCVCLYSEGFVLVLLVILTDRFELFSIHNIYRSTTWSILPIISAQAQK